MRLPQLRTATPRTSDLPVLARYIGGPGPFLEELRHALGADRHLVVWLQHSRHGNLWRHVLLVQVWQTCGSSRGFIQPGCLFFRGVRATHHAGIKTGEACLFFLTAYEPDKKSKVAR